MTSYLPPTTPAQNANNVSTSIQREGKMFVQLWDGTTKLLVNADGSLSTLSVGTTVISGGTYLYDGNHPNRIAGIDSVTYAIETIDYTHHEIHSGSHYYVQGHILMDDLDVMRIKMVTPDTEKWLHFIFKINSTGICHTTLDEAASGGMTGGANVVPINNNRNSTNTSGAVLTSGVTAATGYVLRLEDDQWGAAGFKENIGGGGGREDELMLKQNTTYLRTFTSGADGNIVQFKASWYEHTNKE